jgi:hypothetical protein
MPTPAMRFLINGNDLYQDKAKGERLEVKG